MGGLAPLSYPVVESWARLKDIQLQPHEIDALLLLDSVLLSAASSDETERNDGARQRQEHTSRAERLANRRR